MASTRYDRKPEETEWFSGHKRPKHVGVYRRVGYWVHQFGGENRGLDGFAYWDGARWYISCKSKEDAVFACTRLDVSNCQPRKNSEYFAWLGLKEKPQC